jgi:hypothetical protein
MRSRKTLLLLTFAFGLPVAAEAAEPVRITRRFREGVPHYTVVVSKARLSSVVAQVSEEIGTSAELAKKDDAVVSFILEEKTREKIWPSIASVTGLRLVEKEGRRLLVSGEPRATLDVKDADVREILGSLKRQCGVRNVVIDPGVSGSGTFLFKDVPCSAAFRVVFRSLGLNGTFDGSSVVTVK